MNCTVAVSEWPIIFILLEHQAVPRRTMPLMLLLYDLYEGYLLNCAVIILNSKSKLYWLQYVPKRHINDLVKPAETTGMSTRARWSEESRSESLGSPRMK